MEILNSTGENSEILNNNFSEYNNNNNNNTTTENNDTSNQNQTTNNTNNNSNSNSNSRKRNKMDIQCAMKLLLSGSMAGALIGKGGSTITDMQQTSNARIKLSQNNDFFPGTEERVMLISGEEDAVKMAINLIVNHIHTATQQQQQHSNNQNNVENASSSQSSLSPVNVTLKLLVPSSAGGLIIGRGGQNIKDLSDACGARIQLGSKEDSLYTGERQVNVSGDKDDVISGVIAIINKLSDEPDIGRYQNTRTSYTKISRTGPSMFGTPYTNEMAYGGGGMFGQSHHQDQGFFGGNGRDNFGGRNGLGSLHQPQGGMGGGQNGEEVNIKVEIPDAMVGAILGRGGITIQELKQSSGAQIKISKRGEFVPGTTNRTITITGTSYSAGMANLLISQKIHSMSHSQNEYGQQL